MPLDLADYENKARKAVKTFWRRRKDAKKKQVASGKEDRGERRGVTSGKNMNAFTSLLLDVIRANGLPNVDIYQKRSSLTLPGFFRPTKVWDLLVVYKGVLIAAVELKSHIGPSFGKNFNNRAEEAIGTAQDFRTAFRKGAFRKQPWPFVGWLMMVEKAKKSSCAVKDVSPHFPISPDFKGASYLKRYDLLCQRLVQEHLYTTAAVIAAERKSAKTGDFIELSQMTGLKPFVTALAGHVAAEAARLE